MRRYTLSALALALAAVAALPFATQAQLQPPRPVGVQPGGPARPAPRVERLGPTRLRLGDIQVDTAAREVSAPGHINDATILEFVANTLGGFKAYESAVTVHADAVSFNAALLLIGLDPARARVPRFHFDPEPPAGDAVDVWVEWTADGKPRRVRVEQLLFDRRTNAPLPEGPWVYTGSSFAPNNGPFLAELDGVLIGFVHSPAPLIENPRAGAVSAYGSVVFNERLGLQPKTPVTLIVRVAGR